MLSRVAAPNYARAAVHRSAIEGPIGSRSFSLRRLRLLGSSFGGGGGHGVTAGTVVNEKLAERDLAALYPQRLS
jgi:hypothetical protein